MISFDDMSSYMNLVASGDGAYEVRQYLLSLPEDHRYKDRMSVAHHLIVDTLLEIAKAHGIEAARLNGNVFCFSFDFEKDDGTPDGWRSREIPGRDAL